MLAIAFVFKITMLNTNIVWANEDYEDIIRELIELENENKWKEYSSIWCESQRVIFENLFSDEDYINEKNGIMCVDSANIKEINELPENMKEDINIIDNNGIYTDIKYYFVEIDYSLNHEQFGFNEGINYRLIAVGKENSKVKILAVSEAPDKMVNDFETNIESNKYLRGFRPGYNYNTPFNKKLPKSIKVYVSDEGTIYNVPLTIYVKRVLPNEMKIYGTPMEALKAQAICIQQYAVWNTVYYSKYPNGGYNVLDTNGDQVYSYSYDALPIDPRKKVDDAYAAVSTICMVTKSNLALFESGYVENKSYDKTPNIGKMYQSGAIKLANEGRKFNEILNGYYNNRVLHYGGNIEQIKFVACYK